MEEERKVLDRHNRGSSGTKRNAALMIPSEYGWKTSIGERFGSCFRLMRSSASSFRTWGSYI